MDDLARWLGEQLDIDTARAMAAIAELDGPSLGADWRYDGRSVETVRERTMVAVGSQDFMESGVGEHIAEWDPARVLREIDAKRKVVRLAERAHDYHETFMNGFAAALENVLRLYALAYKDRPGYREEWRP